MRLLKPPHHLHLFASQLLPWFHALAVSSLFFPNLPPTTPTPLLFLTIALAFSFFICQTSGMDDGELCVA